MKIDDDHLYHGSALTQIAEHPQFTAINAYKTDGHTSRSAFRINDDIGVYLKYATKPKGPFDEYVFTFTRDHLDELTTIANSVSRVYLALVCVTARQICCLSWEELQEMIARRRQEKGEDEEQHAVLVTLPDGKAFRAYVNKPGKKKTMLGKPLKIARTDFPSRLFS